LIETGYLDPIPDAYGLEMDYDTVSEFRSFAPDLALYALPFGRIPEGLFYNKAIFDEFRIPYPSDGMTWDEITEIAESMNSERYSGIEAGYYELMASQLSLRFYEPESERVNVESEEWKELIQLLLRLNDVADKSFFGQFSIGETAMYVGPVSHLFSYQSNLRVFGVDWEIAGYPVFDDGRRLQPAGRVYGIGVPARSKNKEDAYKVMRYLLSRESQLENSRRGIVSLRSEAEDFMDQFGASTMLAGKHVSSLLSDMPRGYGIPFLNFFIIWSRS